MHYYALSVLLSAFLLFQIQPMIAKYILPWFGGTPTVWSTVLLFFQALLTGGYAYAYWLLGRLRDRLQGIVHLVLLGVSLGLLLIAALSWPSPLTPDATWRPEPGGLPIWGILRILAVSVGLPYLVLSSNSTLMQAWFGRERRGVAPYHLYALSNAGSLLGLISYPLLLEPLLALRAQAYLWSAGYLIFAISAGYLALRTFRRAPVVDSSASEGSQPGKEKRPGRGMHLLWVGLAACASTLLVSMTNQITQEVAVIPFLWVLPLAIYLLTFILAFSGRRWYSRPIYLIAFFLVTVAGRMMLSLSGYAITAQITLYSLLLFICCMMCHSELYKLRPSTRFLPSFYLMIAAGGAVGGILVTLVAPFLFSTGFWEVQWALIACGILLTGINQWERAAAQRQRSVKPRRAAVRPGRRVSALVVASAVVILLQGAYVIYYMRSISSGALLATRDFYGVNRVWEINTDRPAVRAMQLTHGKTAHGFQFETSELRHLPTTYYAENSGVGLALANHAARPDPLRVGALGLGIGVIASYGQPGDLYRFYEINPEVIRIAEGGGGYFSFLADSQAEVEVVAGDARVSLERELLNEGPQGFDLLVLDTFLGDAMPLHLLTGEAFDVYLAHLKQDGIIAINVSNRYFDLALEVYRLADALDLAAALVQDKGDGIQSYDSVWMLLARRPALLELPGVADRTVPRPELPRRLRAWTDDYSNLLQILK